MKKCAKCGLEKSVESFYHRSATRLHSYCKSCSHASATASYKRRSSDPEFKKHVYEKLLERRLGVTPEQRNELFRKQDGKCAICSKPEAENSGKRLSTDHCHKTGRVRGLLCDNCNRGMGLLGDNLESLLRAVEYLR